MPRYRGCLPVGDPASKEDEADDIDGPAKAGSGGGGGGGGGGSC